MIELVLVLGVVLLYFLRVHPGVLRRGPAALARTESVLSAIPEEDVPFIDGVATRHATTLRRHHRNPNPPCSPTVPVKVLSIREEPRPDSPYTPAEVPLTAASLAPLDEGEAEWITSSGEESDPWGDSSPVAHYSKGTRSRVVTPTEEMQKEGDDEPPEPRRSDTLPEASLNGFTIYEWYEKYQKRQSPEAVKLIPIDRMTRKKALWSHLAADYRRIRRQNLRLRGRLKASRYRRVSTAGSSKTSCCSSSQTPSMNGSVVGDDLPLDAFIDFSTLRGDWEVIGKGRFATVYRAQCGPGLEDVAVKQLHSAGTEEGEGSTSRAVFANEICNLLAFRGRCYVLHALGWSLAGVSSHFPPNSLLLVTELCHGGGLLHRLHASRITPREFATISLCIARALAFVHSHGTVHGDVGARNVLLCRDGRAKLADLGLSTPVDGVLPCIAVPWASPELLSNESRKASTANDVWAYGVLLWEMLQYPYQEPYSWITGGDETDALRQIAIAVCNRHHLPQPAVLPPDIEPLWEGLVMYCWMSARERPTMEWVVGRLTDFFGSAAAVPAPAPSQLPPYVSDDIFLVPPVE